MVVMADICMRCGWSWWLYAILMEVVVVVVVVRQSSAGGDVELQGSLPTYGNVELQGGLTRIRDQGRCGAPGSLPSRGFGTLEVVTLAYPSWVPRRVVDGVLIRSSGVGFGIGC